MRPSVAIIGSGAAGAFAYKACREYGCRNIEVYTDRLGKPSSGAFYFHWVPESISEKYEPDDITYVGLGTPDGYAKNQWPGIELGAGFVSSFPNSIMITHGWNASNVWDELWKGAKIEIIADKLSDTDLKDMSKLHDVVLVTFPTQESMLEMGDYLVRIPVHAVNNPTASLLPMDLFSKHDNIIIYNGSASFQWVRCNKLWGKMSLEYSYVHSTDGEGWFYQQDILPMAIPWKKMIARNVMPIGRFARWDRHYLSHQTYEDTRDVLLAWDEGYRDFKELL